MRKLKETAAPTIDPAAHVAEVNLPVSEREALLERGMSFFGGGRRNAGDALLALTESKYPANAPALFVALMEQIATNCNPSDDMAAHFSAWGPDIA
eukprot:3859583-Amphidinium_carterae.1